MADSISALRQAETPAGGQESLQTYETSLTRTSEEFGLAKDAYKDSEKADWPKSGAAYWASPLEGIFASAPYFHNGSVRTLWDVMTPPAERAKTFRTGSTEFDVEGVGLRSEGPFVYDTAEPGKGMAADSATNFRRRSGRWMSI